MKAPRRRLAAAAGLLLLAAATWFLWPDRRPNLLWISVGSLRPDRLGAYGAPGSSTPSMDYLARNGVVFDQAVSDAPWTGAAMASTLTGRFAAHHGVRTSSSRLGAEQTTLAEVLKGRGYATAAIVGSYALDAVFGFDQGFDLYDDRYDAAIEDRGERPHLPSALFEAVDAQRSYRARKLRADSFRTDTALADAAVAWLRRASRMRPFFLWVHFFGPHRPLVMGEEPAGAALRTRTAYDARVRELDDQIGRLLAELESAGLLGRTILVLQGDHGEALGEHAEVGHGRTLFDSVLRVPLVISWPGRLERIRVAEMVRNVDTAPTVLDLLGVTPPADLDGRSLRPRLEGQVVEEEPLLAETWLPAEADFGYFNADRSARIPGLWRRAVRTSRWKYVRSDPHTFINFGHPPPLPPNSGNGREELYDLHADPQETADVAATHPDVVEGFRRLIEPFRPLPGGGA